MDIIQIAAEFLKIDQALVNQYMAEGTVQAIFFLFFFPSVFLIFFVYILMKNKGPEREDFRLLLTVAVYAFIILSGYYTWFVWLSKWWLYLLLLLGAWYMITHHTSSGKGGNPGKQMPGFGGVTTFGKIMNLTRGDPLNIKGEISQLEIDMIRVKNNPQGANELNKSITLRMQQLTRLIENDPKGAFYKNDLQKLRTLATK